MKLNIERYLLLALMHYMFYVNTGETIWFVFWVIFMVVAFIGSIFEKGEGK